MPEETEEFSFQNLVVKSKDVEGLKAEYKLQIDSMQANVEPNYFWFIDFLKKPGHFGLGMSGNNGRVEKLKDIYTAGVTSAYWGAVETRKGVQIEKAMAMLGTIGQMVKATFAIVREIRVIKEKLSYYESSKKGDMSAEMALKGTWVDMVEGGPKNPASVYGLGMQVGFATLPDLFFKVTPKNSKDVDRATEKAKKDLGLNLKIIEVLRRKLKQFMEWKEKTFNELTTREKFMLKYLRQHYNNVKLYMNWLRPYLKNVRELQMQGESTDAALAKAFETSKIELEIIGIKNTYTEITPEGFEIERTFKKYFPGVWVSMKFIAMPMMTYQKEYQRGAIHMGTTEIAIRGVVITEDDLKKYRDQQEKEDVEIINSVFESMEALGEEFISYLKEAGEKVEEKEVKEEKETIFTPFAEVFKGFKEMFAAFKPKKAAKEPGEVRLTKAEEAVEKAAAKSAAKKLSFTTYDVFKKSHKLMAW